MGFLNDGHSTRIQLVDSDLTLIEKEVTPPSIEGGGAINITNMANTTWRTKAAKSLKEVGNCSFTASYDPNAYDEAGGATGVVNKNQEIQIGFPDGDLLTFYGFVDVFAPQTHTEGEEPTVEVEIVVTNINPADGSETGPVYAASGGSGVS